MIFSTAKKSCPRHEIIKIKGKASKKRSYYSSNRSSIEPDSNSSLSSYSDREELINPTEHKKIYKLDHIVTDNIKKIRINIMTPLNMSRLIIN